MQVKIGFYIYLLLSVAFISCSPQKREVTLRPLISEVQSSDSMMIISSQLPELPVYTDQCITIQVPSENELIEAADILGEYEYIPLETTDECLISRIDEIEVFQDQIFIFDKWTSKALYSFSKEGKFICRYGNVGRGPGEYLTPMSFTIDEEKKEVLLMDYSYKKILRYSLDGTYLGEIPMYYKFLWMKKVGDQFVLFMERNENPPESPMYPYGITIADKNFHPLNVNFKMPFNQKDYFADGEHCLTKMLGHVHAHFSLSDTVWMYRDNAWVAKYKVAAPDGETFPYSSWGKMTNELYHELQEGKRYYSNWFMETEDMAMFHISDDGLGKQLLYDKISGNVRCGMIHLWEKKRSFLASDLGLTSAVYDSKYFITKISAESFLQRVDNCKEAGIPLTTKEEVVKKKLRVEDNPVLIKFKFKHF